MNWDAIGAIGEIVGALAVVFSLIYLASQIRVSNLASRQAAMREIQDLSSQFLGSLASNTANARVWALGGMDDPQLSIYERVQYRVMLLQLTNLWERMYRAQLSGELDSWIWENTLRNVRRVISSAGYKAWHTEFRHIFSPLWYKFIEDEMSKNTEEYTPQGVRQFIVSNNE